MAYVGRTRKQIRGESAAVRQRVSHSEESETGGARPDRARAESDEQFRTLIENSLDGIAVLNGDLSIRFLSPSVEWILGYRPEELTHKYAPGYLHPDDARSAESYVDNSAQYREKPVSIEVRFLHKDGQWRVLEGIARNLLHDPQVNGIVVNYRDITERVRAEEALRERERQFRALIEHSLDGVAVLNREMSATYTSPSAERILGYRSGELTGKNSLELVHPDDMQNVLHGLSELLGTPPVTRRQEVRVRHRDGRWRVIEGVASNLLPDPAVNGIVINFRDVTERKQAEEARIEQAAALAAAKETSTTLEQLVEERTRGERRRADQLRAINEVARKISSILNLDELIPYVAGTLQETFGYYNVNILLLDTKSRALVLRASAGGYKEAAPIGSPIEATEGVVGWAVRNGRGLMVNDVSREPKYSFVEELADTRSELAVPIKIGAEIVGVLDIRSADLDAFDEIDLFTAETLADQLAVALQNARLYEQAQEIATVEERQRLARDLHDAVTQTLFSASLIAEVLPQLWEADRAEARRRLEEIRQLTRGALAEMRMLLLELRPAALTELGLGELLRQMSEATTGRTGLPVRCTMEGQCTLPPDVQIAIYRVAQEALNNISKHAAASEAVLSLTCRPGSAELRVCDNGSGFAPESVSPDKLGLGIMRERAEAIGAVLAVRSEVGSGSSVEVTWPAAPDGESP